MQNQNRSQNPKSQIQNPRSKIQNPNGRVWGSHKKNGYYDNPKSKIQDPKSKNQNPNGPFGFWIWDVERPRKRPCRKRSCMAVPANDFGLVGRLPSSQPKGDRLDSTRGRAKFGPLSRGWFCWKPSSGFQPLARGPF